MEDRMGAISSGIFRRQQNDEKCEPQPTWRRFDPTSHQCYSVKYAKEGRQFCVGYISYHEDKRMIFCPLLGTSVF